MSKKVILACTVCLSRNYSTSKNTTKQERMEVRKFCKKCGEYTLHRETK